MPDPKKNESSDAAEETSEPDDDVEKGVLDDTEVEGVAGGGISWGGSGGAGPNPGG